MLFIAITSSLWRPMADRAAFIVPPCLPRVSVGSLGGTEATPGTYPWRRLPNASGPCKAILGAAYLAHYSAASYKQRPRLIEPPTVLLVPLPFPQAPATLAAGWKVEWLS